MPAKTAKFGPNDRALIAAKTFVDNGCVMTARGVSVLRPWRLGRAGAKACAALAVVLSVSAATAQEPTDAANDDFPFDVFKSEPLTIDDSQQASAGFQTALEELQAGRFESAQRLFEIFVAAEPDHPDVAEARRHLAELYRRESPRDVPSTFVPNSSGPNSNGPSPPPPAVKSAPQPAIGPQAMPRAAQAQPPRPDMEYPPVAAAKDTEFLSAAGDRIFFAGGSAGLGGRARTVIAAQARWLKRNPEFNVVVEGHADDPALAAEQMERIAFERATIVRDRLIEEGVATTRLSIAAWGRDKRIALCDSPECSAQNRRAVAVLVPFGYSAEVPAARAVPFASGTAPATR